jgi:hypothetical protein
VVKPEFKKSDNLVKQPLFDSDDPIGVTPEALTEMEEEDWREMPSYVPAAPYDGAMPIAPYDFRPVILRAPPGQRDCIAMWRASRRMDFTRHRFVDYHFWALRSVGSRSMNDPKITAFPGGTIPTLGADPVIVDLLERALGQARDGHLIAIAIVKVCRQPLAFDQQYHTQPGSSHSLAAGIASLSWMVGSALNKDE